MPYILNGEVYYNCSVNAAESNDLGCYHGDGQSQWVKCQQPQGVYVVKFCHVCYINRGITTPKRISSRYENLFAI